MGRVGVSVSAKFFRSVLNIRVPITILISFTWRNTSGCVSRDFISCFHGFKSGHGVIIITIIIVFFSSPLMATSLSSKASTLLQTTPHCCTSSSLWTPWCNPPAEKHLCRLPPLNVHTASTVELTG